MSSTLTRPYASDAWLLDGLSRSVAGRLEWRKDRLRFRTSDGDVFDAAPDDITAVTFPWYYFGGGVKLTAFGTKRRLSFVRPNGAEYAAGRGAAAVESPFALIFAAAKLGDVRHGRAIGRRWREILSTLDATRSL